MPPISPDSWPAVSRLFDQALDLPKDERASWLERLAIQEPDLEPAVRELLAAHAKRETGDFLERGPVLSASAKALGADLGGTLKAGDVIGPYRLLSPLGSGGMAVVWLAERGDGSMDRQIALKLPQHSFWRPGLIERFERERHILSRLEHPHIARLYEAGLSPADGPAAGLPWLALEFVQGTSLTAYCDGLKLGVASRLALAMQVLQAVQFAHTRLVIHRDLKPANILVTADGQVRLLDFGVAKLLQAEDGEALTQLTQVAGAAFTPDYASPEQVRGEALGTASDVYSLGVVLYELLCGQRPYQLRHGSMAQLEQAIIESDPTPPSGRADDVAAGLRGTTTDKLRRQLRGELDTIVLKALKKKPEERYATVAELAEDLRRHRDGEPVLAQPDSFGYRARKVVGRNKLVAGSAAAVMLALSAGLAASLWQAHVAQTERDRALRSAEHGSALSSFMSDLVIQAASGGKDVNLRDLLDETAEKSTAQFGDDPSLKADILELQAHVRSILQGPVAGLPYLEKAEAVLGGHGEWNQTVRIRCEKMPAAFFAGHIKADAAISAITVQAAEPATSADVAAVCLYQAATIQSASGNAAVAADTMRRALRELDRSGLANHKERAVMTGFLAGNLGMAGKISEAEPLFEAANRAFERQQQQGSLSATTLRGNWVTVTYLAGDARRALQISDLNLAQFKHDQQGRPLPAALLYMHASQLSELGRYEEAVTEFRTVLDLASATQESRYLLAARAAMIPALLRLGRSEAAEREYEAAAALHSPALEPGHLGKIGLLQSRALLDLDKGDFSAASRNVGDLLADKLASKPQRQQALITRAMSAIGAGEGALAVEAATEAVAMGRDLQGGKPYSFRTGRALLALAKAKALQGAKGAAAEDLRESVTQLTNSVDDTHPALVEARGLLEAVDNRH